MCPCPDPGPVPDQLALPNNPVSPNQYVLQHPTLQHPTLAQYPTLQHPTPQHPTPQHPTPQHPTPQHPSTLGGNDLAAVVSSVCSTLIVLTALLIGYFKKYGCCCNGAVAAHSVVSDKVTVTVVEAEAEAEAENSLIPDFAETSLIDESFHLAPKTLNFDMSASLPLLPDSRSVHFVENK